MDVVRCSGVEKWVVEESAQYVSEHLWMISETAWALELMLMMKTSSPGVAQRRKWSTALPRWTCWYRQYRQLRRCW